jgi:hypothetical protein
MMTKNVLAMVTAVALAAAACGDADIRNGVVSPSPTSEAVHNPAAIVEGMFYRPKIKAAGDHVDLPGRIRRRAGAYRGHRDR